MSFSVIILKYFFEANILNIYDLNTILNYLFSKLLSFYCIFDIQNLVLCLTRELLKFLDYKIMRK
jgi:hypothetical protein